MLVYFEEYIVIFHRAVVLPSSSCSSLTILTIRLEQFSALTLSFRCNRSTTSCIYLCVFCVINRTYFVIASVMLNAKDALNCAFCQEASLQASLSDVSDLEATSPPSMLYLSVRNPLRAVENSPEMGVTPLRATRVRRRLTDNISFREALKNGIGETNEEKDDEKTPVRNPASETEPECKATDLVSGLRDGLGRVAAGILGKCNSEFTSEWKCQLFKYRG